MNEDILKKGNNLKHKIDNLEFTLNEFIKLKKVKKIPIAKFETKIKKYTYSNFRDDNTVDYVNIDDEAINKEILQVIEEILRKHLEQAKKEFKKL